MFFAISAVAQQLPDSISKKISTQKDTAKFFSLRTAMFFFVRSGDYYSAEKYAMWMMQFADTIKYDRGKAIAATSVGISNKNLGNYSKAVEYYLLAYKYNEKLKNKYGMATAYMNLGNLYLVMSDYKKALEYQKLCLKTYDNVDSSTLSLAYSNLGIAYNAQYINDSAEYYYKKSLVIREAIHDSEGIAACINNIGILFLDSKRYADAIKYFSEYIKLSLSNYSDVEVAIGYLNRSECYGYLSNYSASIADANLSLKYALSSGVTDVLIDVYKLLSSVYEKSNNYDQALVYAEKYRSIKDSLINESSSKAISEMQTKFETEKKVQEIELLTQEKNINNLSIEQQQAVISRKNAMMLFALLSVALVVCLVVIGLKRNKNKKAANILLYEINNTIELQKNILEEKQQLVLDSVEYAKTIQQALMKSNDMLRVNVHPNNNHELIQPYFYKTYANADSEIGFFVYSNQDGVPGALTSVHISNVFNNYAQEGVTSGKIPFMLMKLKSDAGFFLKNIFDELTLFVVAYNIANNQTEIITTSSDITLAENANLLEAKKTEIKTVGQSTIFYRYNSMANQLVATDKHGSYTIKIKNL
jgi:tetratricopeptide (TPR) repeat protein